jgi:hypothetical protein
MLVKVLCFDKPCITGSLQKNQLGIVVRGDFFIERASYSIARSYRPEYFMI